MTALTNLTTADLEKLVRDSINKVDADRAADNMARAQESGERIVKDGGGIEALVRTIRELDRVPRAVVENGVVVSDPFKGKGVRAARFVRCAAIAAEKKCLVSDVAKDFASRSDIHADDKRAYGDLSEMLSTRALQSNVLSQGGALVPPELAAEMVEMLYARTVVLALGARSLDFTSSISLGRMNSGATVSYVGETANIVPSQPGFGELRMTGRKASALVAVTNELLRNPSVSADTIIRDDLLMAMALRRDLSALRGTGDTFQPKGISRQINASNIYNSTGTTTAQKVADLCKAIRLVDESNVPLDSGGWCVSPRTKWALFATLDANSNFVFASQLAAGMLLGFPLKTTTQVPNNLGGGSDSEVYFGAWSDLIIGFDRATPMQVEAFPNGAYFDGSAVVAGISNDTTPIRLLEGHDVLARHDNTFARIDAVAWA
jgi:HK97 family phage major capsid protein